MTTLFTTNKVYRLLCLLLTLACYSTVLYAEDEPTLPTPQPLLYTLPDAAFHARWQRCGQHLQYRPPRQPVSNKMPDGTVLLVADFYRQAGFKCYLDEYRDPFIIQRGPNSQRLSIFFKKSNLNSSLLQPKHYRALYDFLSTDLLSDADFYAGAYDRYIAFNLTFLKKDDRLYGFQGEPVILSNQALEFEIEKLSEKGEYYIKFRRCYYDKNYVRSEKEHCATLLIKNHSNFWIEGNEIYLSMGLSKVSKGKLKLNKLAFTPQSADPNRYLNALAQQLGAALNALNGLESEWVQHWIEGEGLLTVSDSCQRRQAPNRERLKVWLQRYLAHQGFTLQPAKTYYFSRDLGVYKLMDHVQGDCQPDTEE